MFLKQRKTSTDPRLRSLLQKAARRGYVQIVERVVNRLFDVGDKTWLRSRAAVITFEECWPLAGLLSLEKGPGSKVEALVRVSRSIKQKDAAGLGAMAYALHEGDSSPLEHLREARPLRIVAEGLARPAAFFAWAEAECQSESQLRIVLAAKAYLAAATWGWDKTCILAGAFLASQDAVPDLSIAPQVADPFPYWVALDKHTPQGKVALHQIAGELEIPYRKIIWAGFYFESALTNGLAKSPWWLDEQTWRLKKAGMSPAEASELWSRVRPLFRKRIAADSMKLEQSLELDPDQQQRVID